MANRMRMAARLARSKAPSRISLSRLGKNSPIRQSNRISSELGGTICANDSACRSVWADRENRLLPLGGANQFLPSLFAPSGLLTAREREQANRSLGDLPADLAARIG